MDKPPLIQRIDDLEEELGRLKQAFLDHWKWHRGEEQHIREVATHFHERMGISYAIAPSWEEARRGALLHGPSADLVKLRDEALAKDGYVMVMFEDVLGNAPRRHIVSMYTNRKWKDVVPPEELT